MLGTAEGLETRLVPARGYQLRTVPAVPLPRRPGPDLLRLPGRLRGAVRAAADALRSTDADVVVGFGGYVSAPGLPRGPPPRRAVRRARAEPLPGLANRLGARLTRFVATTFARHRLPHAVHIGMPLRQPISALAPGGDERRPAGGPRRARPGPATGRRCWSSAARRAPGG